MKAEKRKELEKAGWRVGSTADFLALTTAEEAYVEMKVARAAGWASPPYRRHDKSGFGRARASNPPKGF
ncbi:MAG: hypothetical protein ABSH14_12300 [Verrucomicrobiia bacterium]